MTDQKKAITYDLNSGVPKVLLFGNGLFRSFGGDSWNSFLQMIWKNKKLKKKVDGELTSPMILRSELITNGDIKSALKGNPDDPAGQKERMQAFYGKVENAELRGVLQRLLGMGFDDILTTNYDYALEIASTEKPTIAKSRLDRYAVNATQGKAETKYLLHTYNAVPYGKRENRIWHIHGEAKKQDSMLLSLYYYCRLVNRILGYVESRRNEYHEATEKSRSWNLNSWIDSFILGDVYVMGFGFNYAEIDLWWLLERKFNERKNSKVGKVIFYTPYQKDEQELYALLELFDVEIRHLGTEQNDNWSFKSFYYKTVEDMEQSLRSENKQEEEQ